MLLLFVLILGAFLFGSISSAILICRLLQLPDPRTQGSGNPGTTNVLRIGGKKAAAAVLFLDLAKGALPVFLAQAFFADDLLLVLVGMAAFLGHIFPIFYRFKGGKGVATFFGVLFALEPVSALLSGLTWLLVLKLGRISSLAALVALMLAPFYFAWQSDDVLVISVLIVMASIVFWTHRGNISRLLKGQENKTNL